MIDGHITDEQVLAFIDHALPEIEQARVARHARRCRPCSARIRDAEQLDAAFSAALEVVDACEPRRWVREAPRRRVPATSVVTTRFMEAGKVRLSLSRLRWAAVALLCVAGLASATLRRPGDSRNARDTAASAADAKPAFNRTGVVVPARDSIFVIIDGAGSGSLVKFVRDAQRQDGSYVEVTGVSSPVFQSDGGMLRLALGGRVAEVHLSVPAGLRVVRIDANGRSVVRVDGDRVDPTSASDIGIRVAW